MARYTVKPSDKQIMTEDEKYRCLYTESSKQLRYMVTQNTVRAKANSFLMNFSRWYRRYKVNAGWTQIIETNQIYLFVSIIQFWEKICG